MTSTARVSGTAEPAEPVQKDDYAESQDYTPGAEPDTQIPAPEQAPPPYARIVAAPPQEYEGGVPVYYDHARAQREMDFLRLNQLLESRRK